MSANDKKQLGENLIIYLNIVATCMFVLKPQCFKLARPKGQDTRNRLLIQITAVWKFRIIKSGA